MHFRGKPQSSTNITGAGKKRIAKLAAVPMLGGAFMYGAVVAPSGMHLEGMLQGDLVPVAPLFRAQINQPLATCYGKVKLDEPLAIVSNFMLDEQYSSDYQNRVSALNLEQINQNEGLAAAAREVQIAQQDYVAAAATAKKMQNLADSYDELYAARAIGMVARDSALADAMRANAEAGARKGAWQKARFAMEQLRKGGTEKIDSLEKQIALLGQTQKRVSRQALLSPATGQVVDCTARPNAVVEAGTPIYQVFDTDRAYVMVFADPSEAADLSVGMAASVSIPGIAEALPGHIAAVTLEATKLPEPLTRYFWQHNQWAQYRPIKITIDNLDKLKPELRDKLIFNSKVKASISVSSWSDWIKGKA